MKLTGQPTVILAKTIKGWTLGSHFEGRNSTHQMKHLTLDDIKDFRDRLHIPIADRDLDENMPPYARLAPDSEEKQYMMARRAELGGSVPRRRTAAKPLPQPPDKTYALSKKGSGNQSVATTMAFVRLFKDLIRDKEIGHRFVPIIPDEARTFGMDSLFPSFKIYSPHGHTYISVDRALMLSYKESQQGQILHEGINEAGSTSSFIAAGTSYSTHDEPMIPVYIFYSMFGFQRTGDSFWAAMDQMARGFVIGATAGRTTLAGEGLQHNDGQSPLLASTNPAAITYDPAYAYEIGHIVKSGMARMFGEKPEEIFFYITVYNEPMLQPAEPADLPVSDLLKGMYLLQPAASESEIRSQILASGVAVPWALEAQELLANDWGVQADVWSVTSWTELRRDGMRVDRENLLNPTKSPRTAFVYDQLVNRPGPVIAVSDFMRSVQDQIRQWVPQDFMSLGTDGWGRSDTRPALRRHFMVDAESIVVATLWRLAVAGEIDPAKVDEAIEQYQLTDPAAAAPSDAGGDA